MEDQHECNKDCDCPDEKNAKEGCGCSGHSGGKKEFLGLKVYPGQTIKWKGRKALPNSRCPCGSGKKFKKCCGH